MDHTLRLSPCEGLASDEVEYNDDGSVGWKKEIWFTGGYTDELAQAKPTDSIVGKMDWLESSNVQYQLMTVQ